MVLVTANHGDASSKELVVKIDGCDVALMIALRRTIIAEINTIAIAFDPFENAYNDITVVTNTGALHNELLCHRVSLLPLHFTRQEIKDFVPDRFEFELQAIASGSKHLDVTSDMIKVYIDGQEDAALASRVFPADPITKDNILITRLRSSIGQIKEELHLKCKARAGCHRQHARWSAVSRCSYDLTLDEQAVKDARSSLENNQAALAYFDSVDSKRLFIKDKYGNPSSFTFHLESECGMSAYDILQEAFDVLVANVQDVITDCDVLKHMSVTTPDSTCPTAVDIVFQNTTMTTVAFVQAMMYEFGIKAVKNQELTFVGYVQPHPLQNDIILKMQSIHTTVPQHVTLFKSFLVQIRDYLQACRKSFTIFQTS